jgi:hypothetical protein
MSKTCLVWNVWFDGRVIGTIDAFSLKDARSIARKTWGRKVQVGRVATGVSDAASVAE